MKSFKRMSVILVACLVVMFIVVNAWLLSRAKNEDDRPYLVEISRLSGVIESSNEDVSKILEDANCQYVKRIVVCESQEDINQSSIYDSTMREINGTLYRFEYAYGQATSNNLLIVNVIMIAVSIFVLLILVFVGKKIIVPFHTMEEIPYELSKGNLAMDLPEEKTKFFGRFIWGTNMLRENLEERRKKELGMHKEKKLLLLSLTHDIKTPLSVIKLNAQALEKNLYKDEERRQQAVKEIHGKVDEIEQYVTDIVAAAREDFIDLSVIEEDFYLKDLVDMVQDYYRGKLALRKTSFVVDAFDNIMLSGDKARLSEVIQNIIENAIKYGDGEEIRLTFDQDQGCELITIRNTGTPMKQEELIKIFDSFYRGSNVGDKDGSGLGLYICRQLMNNMNGDIFVKQDDDAFMVTLVVRMS